MNAIRHPSTSIAQPITDASSREAINAMAFPASCRDDGDVVWPDRGRLGDAGAVLIGVLIATLTLPPIDACFAMLWWLFVVIIVRSDLTSFIIPDAASLAITVLGLAYRVVTTLDGDAVWPDALADPVATAIASGLGAGLAFWAVGYAFRCWRGYDGLGFGDVKLAAASAIWLDLWQQGIALQLATLAAIVVVATAYWRRGIDRDDEVPFGAFLAPAAWMVFVGASIVADGAGTLP